MEKKQCSIYKCMIVGDPYVGKTTYINRFVKGDFRKSYDATMGVEVHPLTFKMSEDKRIIFNCWNCAGNERYKSLGVEGYKQTMDCAIIMYDMTAPSTFINIERWYNMLDKEKPIIICGNKCDSNKSCGIKELNNLIDLPIDINIIDHIQISAKSNYNYNLPFLKLARVLEHDDSLKIVFE